MRNFCGRAEGRRPASGHRAEGAAGTDEAHQRPLRQPALFRMVVPKSPPLPVGRTAVSALHAYPRKLNALRCVEEAAKGI